MQQLEKGRSIGLLAALSGLALAAQPLGAAPVTQPIPKAAAKPATKPAAKPVAAPARPVVVTPAPAPVAIPAPAPPPARVFPDLTAAQADLLRKLLADAGSHGIAAPEQSAAGKAVAAAVAGPTLIRAALDQAAALHGGRLRPGDYIRDWGMRPAFYDPWPTFVAAVKQDRLAAWIAALPPPYTGYDSLRKGLARYREIVRKGGWSSVPAGPALGVGAKGDRVAALRKRLAIEDSGVEAGGAYDAALALAVQRAQKRYGLEPTGVAGPQTIAALNVSAADRADQIVANLERWRWLPPTLETHRVQVNIAAAVLTVFEADRPVTSMRAVTGRPGNETPMLESRINSIVLNPPWNVPNSIATKELWPKERANPGYLKRNDFRVIETPDGGKRLQQRAGDKSALGRLKFDFDNDFAVYLHDTPSQGTFDRSSRLASHGCVRVQRPVDLAKLMFEGDPQWTPEAIDAALAKGDTVRAKLGNPVAVYLFYWTAFAGANGQMGFRDDPYGWDGLLASKVDAAARGASPLAVASQ